MTGADHGDSDRKEFDHRDLVASLSADERAEILEKSDRAGLMHLAGHLGAILVCASLVLARVPFYPLVLLPLGVLIVFLFTPLHETIHGTAFRSQRLNDTVASFCGFLVFLPPTWFRYFHFAHHRYTHDAERDPELSVSKPTTWPRYLLVMTGILDWISRITTILRNAVFENNDAFVPQKGRARVRREARIFCALYGLVAFVGFWGGGNEIALIWILPLLIGGPFLRAYLLAEHTRCPHVANMLENTRTTFTTALVRFLAWNMPYHSEHHAYPTVPFHKLPLFHKMVRAHLRSTENGYVRFTRKYIRGISDGSLAKDM